MAKYKAYPEYKDSGVEWLGEIPSSWDMWKLSHAYEVIGSGTTPTSSNETWFQGDIPWVTTGELRETIIYDTFKKITPFTLQTFSALKIHPAGSIVIAMYGATIGRLGILGVDATTNQACCVMTKSYEINNQYLYYWLQAFREDIIRLSSGGGQPNINQEKVASLKISSPAWKEQVKITAFLDHETAKIDKLIEKQQQLIELLKEKRQAVISEVVNVRVDETSIKLKNFVYLQTGYPFPSSKFEHSSESSIPLLRGINVGVDNIKWDDVVYWKSHNNNELANYLLNDGDIVFGMDRPWISAGARVAEITNVDLPCLLLQRVARLRANNKAYQPFIKLCLGSGEFRRYVEFDLTGVSVPHISPEQINNFRVRNLPFNTQVFVTEKALMQLKKLKVIEQIADQAIELLQERRTALISAAVTGKIDVRDWVAPDTHEVEVLQEVTA
ncbi:TPA: restriction endonuclease subunit S [Yersinia enterocolitica]|nr:restriction endonuclease subunit S [Yersinia enterocolitica]HDL6890053.1 restriction endonuclease subunit S [Yersinia enterocolitica]